MNGRIYDPLLGRFLSADTMVDGVGNLQGYNRYSYVKNNPLRYVDPDGKAAKDAVAGVGDSLITNAAVSALSASENANYEAAGLSNLISGIQSLLGFHEAAAQSDKVTNMHLNNVQLARDGMQQAPAQAEALMSRVTGSSDANHPDRVVAHRTTDVVTVLAAVVAPAIPAALERARAGAPKPQLQDTVPEHSPLQQQPQQQQAQQQQHVESGELQGPLIIPNNATVVRGGSTVPGGGASAQGIAAGSGVVPGPNGTVSGVSVNAGVLPVDQLAVPPIKNSKIGVTTAGNIRAAGGAVTPAPNENNPTHALVSDISAEELARRLKEQQNPNKR